MEYRIGLDYTRCDEMAFKSIQKVHNYTVPQEFFWVRSYSSQRTTKGTGGRLSRILRHRTRHTHVVPLWYFEEKSCRKIYDFGIQLFIIAWLEIVTIAFLLRVIWIGVFWWMNFEFLNYFTRSEDEWTCEGGLGNSTHAE